MSSWVLAGLMALGVVLPAHAGVGTVVPEPASLTVLAVGVGALAIARLRRK